MLCVMDVNVGHVNDYIWEILCMCILRRFFIELNLHFAFACRMACEIFVLKYICEILMKNYLHEYLTYEYFHTQKFPDQRYTNNNTHIATGDKCA